MAEKETTQASDPAPTKERIGIPAERTLAVDRGLVTAGCRKGEGVGCAWYAADGSVGKRTAKPSPHASHLAA